MLQLTYVTLRNVGYESRRCNVFVMRSPHQLCFPAKVSVNSNKHRTCLHQSSSSNGGCGGGGGGGGGGNGGRGGTILYICLEREIS